MNYVIIISGMYFHSIADNNFVQTVISKRNAKVFSSYIECLETIYLLRDFHVKDTFITPA